MCRINNASCLGRQFQEQNKVLRYAYLVPRYLLHDSFYFASFNCFLQQYLCILEHTMSGTKITIYDTVEQEGD